MSDTHHARRPKKKPRRHAGDAVFHLDNAMRSVNAVMNQARDRDSFERAQRLRDTIQTARQTAIDLKGHLGRVQATEDQARKRAA